MKSAKKFWKAGELTESIKLPRDVIRRPRKKGKVGDSFDFIAKDSLVDSSNSKIYQIEQTLSVTNGKPSFKPPGYKGNSRLVKIRTKTKESIACKIPTLFSEFERTKPFPHLKIKQPVKVDNKEYLVMRRLKGQDLYSLINDADKGIGALSWQRRLELSCSMLNALCTQVAEGGWIHRDIKPENIIVDLKSRPIQVGIIDYEYCIHKNNARDFNLAGTIVNFAPELFYGQSHQSQKQDVFAMGRILALIWGADYDAYAPELYDLSTRTLKEIQKILIKPALPFHSNAFLNNFKIPQGKKTAIKGIIEQMLDAEPQNRCSANQAYEHFQGLTKVHVSKTGYSLYNPLPEPSNSFIAEEQDTFLGCAIL